MLIAYPPNNGLNKRFISAAKSNNFALVKRLIKDDMKNDINYYLRLTSGYGYLYVVKMLIQEGANIHANNDEALILSARCGRFEIVKLLIEHGANVQVNNNEALGWAAKNGHLDTVKFLLTHGANIHAQDDYALRFSAFNGRLETVKFLITQGVNIHANNDGALRMASSRNHNEVWKVLSAFIQEEKLLLAASDSNGASTWVCSIESGAATSGTAVGSVTKVATSGVMLQAPQVELKKSLHSKI